MSGTAADTAPRLVLSVLRDIISGRSPLTAVRHPLGFLCFPVQRQGENGICLHLWSPAAERALTTSEIHAHSWDLLSYVLYGTLRDERLHVAEAASSATHRIFEVRSHGDADELRATDRLVTCRLTTAGEQRAGDAYMLPAGEFHATVVPGTVDAATLVLSRSRPGGADLSLGPIPGRNHTVTRSRCDPTQTARAASLIADRLSADIR
ncbi:MAG TPA: hypothetical protein VNF47_08850 [Streptosporangiaceae bacterium]|nr:hypothetical protein [Streptosporangiaceae bacterium]